MHFVKVYGSILYSSIWAEDHPTRILWITLLAMADSTGYVEAATPGLARVANITGEECKRALEILQAPDIESKNQDYGGARVEKVEGGWQLLNYQRYREQRTESQVKRAERQARYRAKQKASTVDDVDDQKGEGRGERGDRRNSGERRKPREISEHPSKQSPEPAPTTAKGKAVVVRDHNWVETMVQHLTKSDWVSGRAVKEALVAFNFHRWVNQTTNRQIFSGVREARAAKLIKQYGLVRVLLAIQGQQSHPDFNQRDGRTFRGWDNLFRVEKGLENVEKCSDHALKRGDVRSVLRALGRLQEERGWTPTEADTELFETIGGTSG
jgi:hypothetical protein